MNIWGSILFYFPSLAFTRYANQILASSLGPDEAQRIWGATLKLQPVLAKQRPRYSFGANLIFRYMEWDCALYRAARDSGFSEAQAKQLVEEVNWKAFGPMTVTTFKLSRFRSPNLLRRTKWIVDLMFRVFFTAPFRRNSFALTDEVAFDVVACPIAKYSKDQGAPELTSSAACGLDHRMAAAWGMTLHRTQTIADGFPLCDFRFRKAPNVGHSVAQLGVPADGPRPAGSARR